MAKKHIINLETDLIVDKNSAASSLEKTEEDVTFSKSILNILNRIS